MKTQKPFTPTLFYHLPDFYKLQKNFNIYFSICFFQNKTCDNLYLYIRNLEKSRLKRFFSVHNIHLYLCWQVEITKWILCSRKMMLNGAHLRFLMYKIYFSSIILKFPFNIKYKTFIRTINDSKKQLSLSYIVKRIEKEIFIWFSIIQAK